jgi:caffeoyl-CoA O-methyltransferase
MSYEDALSRYIDTHTDAESHALQTVNRDTHLHVMLPRMLSGHAQGRMLAMISKMIKPKCILEIGTFTGYSAMCLAEGLHEEGQLISIEVNEELEERILKNWSTIPQCAQMKLMIGQAVDVIQKQELNLVDLVFIDADKKNNQTYYDLIVPHLKSGAVILVDNVLWNGKVIDENMNDKDTTTIKAFNHYIAADARVEKIIIPLRDGVFLIRKK